MSLEKKLEFVDRFSLKIEESGRPRIYGQILAWLLICDPPHQSFPDLMQTLNISKASVSNTTRQLIEMGFIEKVRISGERQIYFRIKENSLYDTVQREIQIILSMKDIVNQGLNIARNDSKTNVQRLEQAAGFYEFLAKELPRVLEMYHQSLTTN